MYKTLIYMYILKLPLKNDFADCIYCVKTKLSLNGSALTISTAISDRGPTSESPTV